MSRAITINVNPATRLLIGDIDKQMALRELMDVSLLLDTATPTFSVIDGERTFLALSIHGSIVATNSLAADGTCQLSLNTTEMIAYFSGSSPKSAQRFTILVWNEGDELLLCSDYVRVANNPIASGFDDPTTWPILNTTYSDLVDLRAAIALDATGADDAYAAHLLAMDSAKDGYISDMETIGAVLASDYNDYIIALGVSKDTQIGLIDTAGASTLAAQAGHVATLNALQSSINADIVATAGALSLVYSGYESSLDALRTVLVGDLNTHNSTVTIPALNTEATRLIDDVIDPAVSIVAQHVIDANTAQIGAETAETNTVAIETAMDITLAALPTTVAAHIATLDAAKDSHIALIDAADAQLSSDSAAALLALETAKNAHIAAMQAVADSLESLSDSYSIALDIQKTAMDVDWSNKTGQLSSNYTQYANELLALRDAMIVDINTYVDDNLDALINAVIDPKTELARDWANEAEDVVVLDGEFSSKHYSEKSKAYLIDHASEFIALAAFDISLSVNQLTQAEQILETQRRLDLLEGGA